MNSLNQSHLNNQNNIFYYWEILKKWKKFIIGIVLIITIIATIIAFSLPKWYYSYAVIKPSEGNGVSIFSAALGASGLSALSKNLSVGSFQYSDLDYYQSLLTGRTINLKMIDKFNLKKVYSEKYTFKTIKDLLGNSLFQPQPTSNLLVIGVYDKNPKRARDMVSYYMQLLDSAVTNISKVSLIYNRELIEGRYKQNLKDLDSAQKNLKDFQEKYGVVLPEEQFKSTVKAYAEIEAQKLLLETQLNSLKLSLNNNSPVILNLLEQIKTLDSKINQFNSKNNNNVRLFVPLGKAPGLIDKYVSLYREVKIQSKLLELTYPLFQQAKLNEDRNAPAFISIDKPFVPEYKAKPKKSIVILSGFFGSLIISIFIVLVAEYTRKLKNTYYSN